MTKLLLRLFIKNWKDPASARTRTAIGILSGAVGIGCNLLLFLGKWLVGSLTGSVSITADALNNLSDASGSVVTLIGFRVADKPADEDHPYGHARAEYISALAVAALILVIGLELVKTSVQKIFSPEPVLFSPAALGVLLASIAVKLWMCLFNRNLGRYIDSTALIATSADSRNDCITTTAVLLATLAEHVWQLRVDGIFGLGVAGFILFSGIQLAKDTISPLLGENADPELKKKLVDYIICQEKVLGYHDLMVHDYGPGQRFASLHVEMDYREDPLVCHTLIDEMERECLESHNVHLVIHYDPVITDDPELNRLKEQTAAILKRWDSRLNLHDFRMVQGKHHMNLIFDIPLPSDLRNQGEELQLWVQEQLNLQEEKRYHLKVTFDIPEGR